MAERAFLCREDSHNMRILREPFLVRILLIRVNREAQDVSLHTHAWRPSKALSDLSKFSLSPLASFHQLLIPSRHFGRLIHVRLMVK